MRFCVMIRTYNSYGGHRRLSLIADFLLESAGSFGGAISELTVTSNFSHAPPPRKTLEAQFARCHVSRLSLPNVVFRPGPRRAMVDIASDLIDGSDWRECSASRRTAACRRRERSMNRDGMIRSGARR